MWHAKEDVPAQEALEYWKTRHAVLVRQVPGIRRYVQHHCVESPQGGVIPYTGLGKVWFDSFETAAVATGAKEWDAVIADADTFMDLTGVAAAWAEEHELIPLSRS
jgi:uncharacterized protein (TIGR02118 family)